MCVYLDLFLTATNLHNGGVAAQQTLHALLCLYDFLLTLPVTSSSCERAHSKVDIVKSAVRASMASERLEDLILISSEKKVLDRPLYQEPYLCDLLS